MSYMILIILILQKNTLYIAELMLFNPDNLEIVSNLILIIDHLILLKIEKVYGLVIRTGFVTTKGALVRDILYPK